MTDASQFDTEAARPLSRLLTVGQVAEILACSIKTVRRLIGDGTLPSLRIGNGVRVSEDDLRAFLDWARIRHATYRRRKTKA
jgi:excisionase family DNA binding protein